MKVEGRTLLVETFTEAYEVFYAPVDSEELEGTNPAWFAATLYGNAAQTDYNFGFARPEIARYWEKLEAGEFNRRLVDFDFTNCTEGTRSWYGYGDDCISRLNDTRVSKAYHAVAMYVATKGYTHFEFDLYDDYKLISRVIRITYPSSPTAFLIEDTVDPNLYEDMAKWIASCAVKQKTDDIVVTSNRFIGGY